MKNLEVIDLANENGVEIIYVPLHITHKTQPADVAFKILSLIYIALRKLVFGYE